MQANDYVLTLHAYEEMKADDLTVFDVERCVLSGEIVDRQRDRSTGEWKYLIHGEATDDSSMAVVAKLGPTDKVVLVTVFLL
jgi:hypothetical protein